MSCDLKSSDVPQSCILFSHTLSAPYCSPRSIMFCISWKLSFCTTKCRINLKSCFPFNLDMHSRFSLILSHLPPSLNFSYVSWLAPSMLTPSSCRLLITLGTLPWNSLNISALVSMLYFMLSRSGVCSMKCLYTCEANGSPSDPMCTCMGCSNLCNQLFILSASRMPRLYAEPSLWNIRPFLQLGHLRLQLSSIASLRCFK